MNEMKRNLQGLDVASVVANGTTHSCGGGCSDKAKQMFCTFPNSITLTVDVVAGAGFTGAVLSDAVGLFPNLGIATGYAPFNVRGSVSAVNVQKFLQTHRGQIELINYESTLPSQLNNKIKLVSASIDETNQVEKVFDVAADKRNTQFDKGLMTVYPKKGEAWLTNTSGLMVSGNDAAAQTINITLQFSKWSSYEDISC